MNTQRTAPELIRSAAMSRLFLAARIAEHSEKHSPGRHRVEYYINTKEAKE